MPAKQEPRRADRIRAAAWESPPFRVGGGSQWTAQQQLLDGDGATLDDSRRPIYSGQPALLPGFVVTDAGAHLTGATQRGSSQHITLDRDGEVSGREAFDYSATLPEDPHSY